MLHKILPLALLAAHTLAAQAADQVTYYREGQRIDPQEVATILARPTRSIRLLVQEPAGAVAVAAPSVPTANAEVERVARVDAADEAPADGAALSLPVRFGFDSADILPTALAQLDAVAQGLQLLPPDQAVLIEGHTDARGQPGYNLGLSRRRAEAVKRYLVSAHGLDAARLLTVGFGMDRPVPGSDPSDPHNRRVQLRGVPMHVASAAGYFKPLR